MHRLFTFLTVGGFCGLVAALIVVGLADDDEDSTTVDSDWGFFRTSDHLVASSDLIVIAKAGDHETETVDLRSPVTGEITGSRSDRLQHFTIVTNLKGNANTEVVVRMTEALRDKLPSGGETSLDLKLPGIKTGATYVLFLDPHNTESGGAEFAPAGLPWIAEIVSSKLRFILSADQAEGLKGMGIDPGTSGAGSALDLTTDSLRAVIASSQKPAPGATSPAP